MAMIDFWYSIGSTYSYLTVMRLPSVAQTSGIEFRWRPFNVRHVMASQNNVPFKDKPEKSAHVWRDIERRATRYGLHPSLPASYPLAGLVLANQVAVLASEECWVEPSTRATYRRWFDARQPAGEEPNISESLTEVGQDPHRVLALAQSDRIMSGVTDEAMAIGVFGSPSFVVNSELYWGDDRLDDAVEWALALEAHQKDDLSS